MQPFFYEMWANAKRVFTGRNLFWHALAIFLTWALVATGFDWYYFTSLRNTILFPVLFPAAIIGGLLPIFGPFILLWIARMKKDPRLMNAAYAFGQANFLGWAISSAYKLFTGRIQPPSHLLPGTLDTSAGFRFGLFRGGIFWGWPSSHTMVAFAGAVALAVLYSDRKNLRYFFILYAFYIGFGISFSIHWFSDFVAGAIIGTLIGLAVGKSFLKNASHHSLDQV